MTEKELIEKAFREGYVEGYNNAVIDSAAYHVGCGSKHLVFIERDKNQAWEDSKAKALYVRKTTKPARKNSRG